MADDIAKWLEGLGLGQYAQAFAANEVVLSDLPHLTDDDLKALGLSLGPRRRLQAAIKTLDSADRMANTVASGVEQAAPSTKAERRQLTVMFCDLAGSTALSTRLDPEDMRDVIRAYQDTCAGVITRFNGYLAKYMGDGILAYFGWPRGDEDDAERAIRAALGIVDAVGGMAPPKGRNEKLAVRIGMATGPVVVGDIVGEGAAQEAAVTGETPNLAARLQEIAEPNSVVINATTRALVGDLFAYRPRGAQTLKGIDGAVEAWEVTGEKVVESRFEAVRGRIRTPLVGREHELALLCDRWSQASGGEGQVLLLSGEAGIGKSRLTRALMDFLEGKPHVRLRFQCSPYHTDSAFNPIIRQLERAARFERDTAADAKLDKLEELLGRAGPIRDDTVPLIANLLSLPYEERFGALDLTPQQVKQHTIEILMGQVFGLAAERPVLFLFEDAHWIDPTSLELLELLATRVNRAAVLAVITHRPEWTAPFANQAHVTSLQLNRLGRRQTAEIVTAVAESSVPEAMVERIIERTDGIPLFVEEMTRSLVEGGYDAVVEADAIPDTLQASLMARLDRLPGPTRELAQVASVIGREVSLPLLSRTMGLADQDIEAATESLFTSQLMVKGGYSGETGIVFRHALIRDAAYQSLLLRRRREIHAKVARAIEAHFPDVVETQPELVARHETEAGNVDSAIRYWRRAGERATDRVANVEAVGHFRNALAQLALLSAGRERDRQELEILLAMGLPLIGATGYASDDVRDNYTKAYRLSEADDDDESLFVSARGLWNCIFDRAELDQSLELSHQLVRLADRDSKPNKIALAQRALGSTLLSLGDLDQCGAAFDAAIEIAEGSPLSFAIREHGEAPQIVAQQYKGWTDCFRGFPDRGVALGQEAVANARALDHPITLAFSMQILAVIHLTRREYEPCRDIEAEVAELAKEHGFVFWSAGSKAISGCAISYLGKTRAGLARAAEGIRDWRATGAILHIPTWSSFLADAALSAGDLELAESTLAESLRLATANGDVLALAELQRLQGDLEIRRGNSDDGVRYLEEALATARQQNAGLYELRAAVDLARLERDHAGAARAIETLSLIYRRFTEGFDTADLRDAKALLDELS